MDIPTGRAGQAGFACRHASPCSGGRVCECPSIPTHPPTNQSTNRTLATLPPRLHHNPTHCTPAGQAAMWPARAGRCSWCAPRPGPPEMDPLRQASVWVAACCGRPAMPQRPQQPPLRRRQLAKQAQQTQRAQQRSTRRRSRSGGSMSSRSAWPRQAGRCAAPRAAGGWGPYSVPSCFTGSAEQQC